MTENIIESNFHEVVLYLLTNIAWSAKLPNASTASKK